MADPVEPDDAEVVDGKPVAEARPPSQSVARRSEPPALTVAASGTAQDLVARLATIRETMEQAMEKDVDYGVIPGTTGKPTLLKPGAEKLMVLFLLDLQPSFNRVYGPGDHLTVECEVTAFDARSGARLGKGAAICSTREKRYAKRRTELKCPSCGKENVRRSRPPKTGFYCWTKTGGCGANFAGDDGRITSQTPGEKDNPDLPDTWNTVLKIAEKRAKVDCVLAVTGASALFTQDLEDKSTEERDAGAQQSSGEPEEPPEEPKRMTLSPRGIAQYRSLIEGAGLDVAEVVKEARIESGRLEDVDQGAANVIKAIVRSRSEAKGDPGPDEGAAAEASA